MISKSRTWSVYLVMLMRGLSCYLGALSSNINRCFLNAVYFRFNVTGKAKPSFSTPQLSKSKVRPQSASTRPRPSSAVKSKVINLPINILSLHLYLGSNLKCFTNMFCFYMQYTGTFIDGNISI